jgi:hypothetical protein
VTRQEAIETLLGAETWLFKIVFFVLGCVLITWGYWLIVTISTRRSWVAAHGCLGISVVLTGFFAIGISFSAG